MQEKKSCAAEHIEKTRYVTETYTKTKKTWILDEILNEKSIYRTIGNLLTLLLRICL